MKKSFVFLLLSFLCLAFSSDVQKRIVREGDFDIECYISVKKLNHLEHDKVYYWFRSGEIHQSLSSVGGNILHNMYSKYYRSNQLAEKGMFNYGLKTGVWKSWNENGMLNQYQEWYNGYKEGAFIRYDINGNIILKGAYKSNLKDGYWIDYIKKDTTYHKNNTAFKERPKTFVERLLRKRDSLEKVEIKTERITKRKNDSIKRAKLKTERLLKKKKDSLDRATRKQKKQLQRKNDSTKTFFNLNNSPMSR
ncbi:MAG TPA: hypothetical protein VGA80_02370 [Flavobacteriaceae bacterium]